MGIKNDLDKVFGKLGDTLREKVRNDPNNGFIDKGNVASNILPIHDTSGGEMPDPKHMPSKTKFHLNVKDNA